MGLVENMLSSRLGEEDSKLKVTFKKTVKVREYETEVIESTNELNIDREITGMERVFIAEILKCQSEFMVYTDLLIRGTVTEHEFSEKKLEIESTLLTILNKGKQVGVSLGKYLGLEEGQY